MLAIEEDGTSFHQAVSKQAERDKKKNHIMEKCEIPLLRLRTDSSGKVESLGNTEFFVKYASTRKSPFVAIVSMTIKEDNPSVGIQTRGLLNQNHADASLTRCRRGNANPGRGGLLDI